MPDEINIPNDLLNALLTARAATRAAEDYGQDLDDKARAEYPSPEQWLQRASWPGEPPADLATHHGSLRPAEQTDELARLRAAASAAWESVRTHQAYAAALEAGTYTDLRTAVIKAAAEAELAQA